jgi:hypothetical protein
MPRTFKEGAKQTERKERVKNRRREKQWQGVGGCWNLQSVSF